MPNDGFLLKLKHVAQYTLRHFKSVAVIGFTSSPSVRKVKFIIQRIQIVPIVKTKHLTPFRGITGVYWNTQVHCMEKCSFLMSQQLVRDKIATTLPAEGFRFQIPEGTQTFLSSKMSRLALGSTQLPMQLDQGYFLGAKWPRCDID